MIPYITKYMSLSFNKNSGMLRIHFISPSHTGMTDVQQMKKIHSFWRFSNKIIVFFIYTDGQKKLYSKILSWIACGSQARTAQAYHDQNLEPSLGVISICRFWIPVMLANIFILIALTICILLSNFLVFYL